MGADPPPVRGVDHWLWKRVQGHEQARRGHSGLPPSVGWAGLLGKHLLGGLPEVGLLGGGVSQREGSLEEGSPRGRVH